MVLVLESVSWLTPTEFKILQPATSQLEKALNNSGINHRKSTAFLEDFYGFLFWYFFVVVQNSEAVAGPEHTRLG